MNTSNDQGDIEIHAVIERLRRSKVGIVGGGGFCYRLMTFFRDQDLEPRKPTIIGVADRNPRAQGYQLAQQLGIFTATEYSALYDLSELQVILEMTHDPDLAVTIQRTKPEHVNLIDHFQVRHLWDTLQIENNRRQMMEKLSEVKHDATAVENLFNRSIDRITNIMTRRNARSRQIELNLVENERTQSQIIQGSTIPTFVINKDHVVTHWNKALEKMSGCSADQVVGTNRQWAPFWRRERPTMADVILDQIDVNDIQALYGSQWRKSGLIDGAYEAEVFFPQVGDEGKWLWFTAAPIKAPDGRIVGAIETLWDVTENKKSEEERERHTAELAALLSIYTALSAPWAIDYRIEAAIKEIRRFLMADKICIYLRSNDHDYYLKYCYGHPQENIAQTQPDPLLEFIHDVAQKGESVIFDADELKKRPELAPLAKEGFQSLAFIPISAKENKATGVLQISSRSANHFGSGESHVLGLIGNRIGVAIENALLQEQYIKSDEKYRSLFNNDPNPIFIVSQDKLKILDVNERAQECYGYSRDELSGMSFRHLGDPEDLEVVEGLAKLGPGQSVLFSKKRHYRKDEDPFYVNISVSHAPYGESHVLIATTTDITESVEKDTQLIQASKMTTLGLMAAGMAHEINQPLNVIQICADFFLKMLNKGQSIQDDDLRTMANDIVENVERATGIIRHVRDFARQSEVIKNRININNPIEDVFKVMGHQIKVHQIDLDLDLEPDIPYIMADHNRLEQVLINLVTNAIDAMDEKAARPEFKSSAKQLRIRTYSKRGKVVISVADTGVGMSDEVQSKIFEPFFTTKKIGKGTGLGVSISYGIVEDYDGTIDIQSQVGEGTTFILTFPALKQSTHSPEDARPEGDE